MAKILITEKQKEQFNQMLFVLQTISKEKMRKQCEKEYGLLLGA